MFEIDWGSNNFQIQLHENFASCLSWIDAQNWFKFYKNMCKQKMNFHDEKWIICCKF